MILLAFGGPAAHGSRRRDALQAAAPTVAVQPPPLVSMFALAKLAAEAAKFIHVRVGEQCTRRSETLRQLHNLGCF